MKHEEILRMLREAKAAGTLDKLLKDADAEDALDELLREVTKEGVIVGLEPLIEEIKIRLTKIRDREHIGLYDEKGKPIHSIRQFAKHMGNESASSNLLQFINGKTTPCFGVIRQAAKALNITYVISNKDKEMIHHEIE